MSKIWLTITYRIQRSLSVGAALAAIQSHQSRLKPLLRDQILKRRKVIVGYALCSILIPCSTTALAQNSTDLNDQSLEELTQTGLSTTPKNVTVTTASKYSQSSRQAPSALRVVTAEDIRTYGYRTVAEALRSLPGIYVTHDRNYTYVGVRGFGQPGDYNTRVLLLIDGERLNENTYDGAYYANEFPVDIDLVERVEFMPGPGSAIYGNNAFFGVVNVITKRGKDYNGAELSAEYGSFDTYKGRGTYGKRFENGAEMLLSATGFDRDGPDQLYYREFDTPEQNHGIAENLDYDHYYSVFGKFSWGPLTLEGASIDRTKGIPTASWGQNFNDSGSLTEDKRTFITATYNDQLAQDWGVYLRLNYHQYDYQADLIYGDPRTVNKDVGFGEWWGGEFRLTNTSFNNHKLVFGMELQDNLQQFQNNYDVGGQTYFNFPYTSTRYGIYLQDEYQLLDSLTLIAGARYDYNPLGGGSANPRVGLIWQALDSTTLKLLYGSAFRAPNVYERFYAGDQTTNKANPGLIPEKIQTLEFILEHFFTPSTRVSASLYHYKSDKLISQKTDPLDDLNFYDNVDSISANGIELEGEQRFRNGIRARASYVWQQTEDANGRVLVNSPQHQAKLNLSAPLWSDYWRVGFETQYMSSRYTLTSRISDNVRSNLNVSGELIKNVSASFGLYNLWNSRYADPVAAELVQDSIIQDGRTFRLKLNVRF